ncbi:LLM class F420-dependent oxidoreductase [Streptomyces sp. NWU339]|uniref:TIGR03619 family F420-dependent LLM class oxidoreductase n=1 Tax=Streptomyces sp. NWU339 TaxID=2185284 RepID=UPI000D672506|nr:TIGR03619 family F420-dependent LLM class oxidoreductase [Streptomyces sp. NWU339]PWI10413.1 LLM class F420-dependent oxidoreductase [Streptomyces sp. NWU339]
MLITVEYPVDGAAPELLTPEGISRVARRADDLGYDAIAFTEHPAPTKEWLESRAGHETLDVTTALAFCAAVTQRIRLMTYLLVLPYHNAFLAAKALGTVDRLSGGRLTVVAGTGYLPEEFEALGVDFDTRNERFDEALEVLRGAWSGSPVDHAGVHFRGHGIVQRPAPVQAGGIPILIGGNSALARRRAARNAGWSPILVTEQEVARQIRMPVMTVEGLSEMIAEIRDQAAGSGTSLLVQVQSAHAYVLRRRLPTADHREHLAQLRGAGVDSFVLKLPAESLDAAVQGLEEYAATYRRY